MSIGRISRETFLIITLKFQNHLRVIPKADSERTSHSPSFFFFFFECVSNTVFPRSSYSPATPSCVFNDWYDWTAFFFCCLRWIFTVLAHLSNSDSSLRSDSDAACCVWTPPHLVCPGRGFLPSICPSFSSLGISPDPSLRLSFLKKDTECLAEVLSSWFRWD